MPDNRRLSALGFHEVVAACCLLCFFQFGELSAQELEPRQYSNIPIGLNFLVAGYGLSQGGVLFDPVIALENAAIDIDGPIIGYARSVAIGSFSGKLDAGIGRACLSGAADYEGERRLRDVCGWTDTRVRLSVNFLGAPARRIEKFGEYRQDLIIGASIQISAPTGQYDSAKLVNIGTNRASAKLEIGMSKALRQWLFELALAGTVYQTNDDFFGGASLQQSSVASLQAHAVRNFSTGIWLAVDWTYYSGGQTRTNGVENNNRLSNSRFGATLSVPINRRQSVKANFSTGVSTRTGTDFNTLSVLWQYRWGSGL